MENDFDRIAVKNKRLLAEIMESVTSESMLHKRLDGLPKSWTDFVQQVSDSLMQSDKETQLEAIELSKNLPCHLENSGINWTKESADLLIESIAQCLKQEEVAEAAAEALSRYGTLHSRKVADVALGSMRDPSMGPLRAVCVRVLNSCENVDRLRCVRELCGLLATAEPPLLLEISALLWRHSEVATDAVPQLVQRIGQGNLDDATAQSVIRVILSSWIDDDTVRDICRECGATERVRSYLIDMPATGLESERDSLLGSLLKSCEPDDVLPSDPEPSGKDDPPRQAQSADPKALLPDVEQLQERTPDLDRESDAWLRATSRELCQEFRRRAGSLKTARSKGQKTPDGKFGVDKNGHVWRRDPDDKNVIWYLCSSMTKNQRGR